MLRVDSLSLQLFHFLKETLRIDDDARADDTDGARIHNAARHKAQRISFAASHNRMSRVVPPLGTDNNVRFRCQVIYNLSFPLIAPLGTNDHSCCHYTFSFLLIIRYFFIASLRLPFPHHGNRFFANALNDTLPPPSF